MKIKHSLVISAILCMVLSDSLISASYWPSWSFGQNKSLDFSSYYMDRLKESNLAILILGAAALTAGLGYYAWSRYRNYNTPAEKPPSSPATSSSTSTTLSSNLPDATSPTEPIVENVGISVTYAPLPIIDVEAHSLVRGASTSTSRSQEDESIEEEKKEGENIPAVSSSSSVKVEDNQDNIPEELLKGKIFFSGSLDPNDASKYTYDNSGFTTAQSSSSLSSSSEEIVLTSSIDLDNYLNRKVKIGESEVEGREYCPTNDVCLIQLKVLDQDLVICNKAVGGGKDSCGYHSVNSGFNITINILGGKTTLNKDLLSQSAVQYRFGLPLDTSSISQQAGEWRAKRIQERQQKGQQDLKGESLNGEEIIKATEELKLNGALVKGENVTWPASVGYIVVEDVKMLGDFFPYLYEEEKKAEIATIKQELKDINQQIIYVFFIATSSHQEQGSQMIGTYGHWIVVVLYKEVGALVKNYIIADSKNIIRLYNDPTVKAIIGFMEGEEVASKLLLSDQDEIDLIIEGIKNAIQDIQQAILPDQKELLRKNLGDLQERYTLWTGRQLPENIVDQVGNALVD